MKKYLIINKSIENILTIMVLILTISAIAWVKTIQNRMLVMEYRNDYRQVMDLLDNTAVMAKSSMDKNDADSFKWYLSTRFSEEISDGNIRKSELYYQKWVMYELKEL